MTIGLEVKYLYVLKSYATSEMQRRATDETDADARRNRDRGRTEGRDDVEQRQDAEQNRGEKER